jgi:hypothetical protein
MNAYFYVGTCGQLRRSFDEGEEVPEQIVLDDGRVLQYSHPAPENEKKAPGSTWPRTCVASGVNPLQAQELRDFFTAHGEKVEVTSEGDPVYTGPRQRRRLLKLRGLHDKNSYQ